MSYFLPLLQFFIDSILPIINTIIFAYIAFQIKKLVEAKIKNEI